jgi:LAS superfamily LD-carboxypeptidase LdcB
MIKELDDGLWNQACGRTESHLIVIDGLAGRYHCEMASNLQELMAAARVQGFELAVASGYRSFERQLAIWQGKASGERPVLDSHGQPLVIDQLTDEELMWAILRWSALPGASRHHWGTDIDVYDRAAVSAGYRLQLIPEEYEGQGPFAEFSRWLGERIEHQQAFGFYRPYAEDCGGVAPEPWHLSYAPQAQHYQGLLTPDRLLALWRQVDLPLLPQVEANIDEIVSRFILVPVAPLDPNASDTRGGNRV